MSMFRLKHISTFAFHTQLIGFCFLFTLKIFPFGSKVLSSYL